MRKRILLINPWIYDFAAYDFWIKPLGLLYIGSLLRKNGYIVSLIDCLNPFHPGLKKDEKVKMAHRKQIGHGKYPKQEIRKLEPLRGIARRYNRYGITPALFREELRNCAEIDMILVTSMMTYWYPGVHEAIRIIKEELPGIPIVLGGNYVTLCPDHALKAGADFTISGSIGEKRMPSLIKKILGDDLSLMPDFDNLDSYPYPAFDLLPYNDQIPLLTSRGCPFRCTYCASHILHDRFIRRDPIKVVDEITFWHENLGIRHFSFYDDALLINPDDMAIPMMKEIIRRKISCQFHCPNGLHLREMTEELSKLMFLAGFKTIRFGFETSDYKRQIETGGKALNDHLERAIIQLKRAGYQGSDIGIYLLCGLPGQSYLDVKESIDYVKSCGGRPIIAEYSPIPGTPLFNSAVVTSIYPISQEPLYHNNSLLPCRSDILTFEMYRDLQELSKLYNNIKSNQTTEVNRRD
jgi:radical SAM superfamily enzyme YgiQ (UPF0313 family)